MDLNLKKFIHLGDENSDKDNQFVHSINVDIIDGCDFFLLMLDLPGIDSSKVKIEIVNGDLLRVTAFRELNLAPLESAILEECSKGKFSKEIVLPAGLDYDNIHSEYKNGVLLLKISKA